MFKFFKTFKDAKIKPHEFFMLIFFATVYILLDKIDWSKNYD